MKTKQLIKKYLSEGILSQGLQFINGTRFDLLSASNGYTLQITEEFSTRTRNYFFNIPGGITEFVNPIFLGYSKDGYSIK